MTKVLILFIVSFCFLLTGCAEYWYQEDKTFDQCLQDRQDCFNELEKRTDFVGSGDYEFEYMTECMQGKGYRLVKEKQLPLDVRRQQPDSSLHWRTKGIAGQPE